MWTVLKFLLFGKELSVSKILWKMTFLFLCRLVRTNFFLFPKKSTWKISSHLYQVKRLEDWSSNKNILFFLPVACMTFFPNSWLLFHGLLSYITIIKIEDRSERGINRVTDDYHQSLETILATLGTEPMTSCSQVLCATNQATQTGHKGSRTQHNQKSSS